MTVVRVRMSSSMADFVGDAESMESTKQHIILSISLLESVSQNMKSNLVMNAVLYVK
jgi:hypothetical protein